jgi:hypothetical protein
VSLEGKRPQKSRQLELPLVGLGETRPEQRSEEAPTATRVDERSGTSGFLLAFETLETFECGDVSEILRARRSSLVLQQLAQTDHVALHSVAEGRADA